jgi:hypothetical protein|tara:strand:+ start:450 stop:581 length:132 start_codon:yes stop_codon:yes gene_type:complete
VRLINKLQRRREGIVKGGCLSGLPLMNDLYIETMMGLGFITIA